MESAEADPNSGDTYETADNSGEDDGSEENQENVTPDGKNIRQLCHSSKKQRTSKSHYKHSVMFEGIEVDVQRVKRHSMISRLDKLQNTQSINLRTRSVIKSEYKYDEIKSGSNVFQARNLFANGDLESSPKSKNTDNIIDKQIRRSGHSKPIQSNQNINSNIPSSSIKESPKINVIGGVQEVEINKLGDGGIKVFEKKLHTVSKPFRISTCSCAVKSQNEENMKPQWTFKARPANVLKKRPFVPKFEKKFTKPENIYLNTEKRAQEWMVFEKIIFEHQEMLRKRQDERKKKEMDLIKKTRQKMVHKAEPIKKYKPILIRKSDKPVTVAHSPKLSKRRIRNYISCE